MYSSLFIVMTAGFLAAWIGMFTGMLLSSIITERGDRAKGATLGFIGGLMLATVCYDLLPESFEIGNMYIGFAGAVIGLILGTYLDGKVKHNHNDLNIARGKKARLLRAASLMALGIGIHNIPGGIALGSMLFISPIKGLHLGVVLLLHGIPEGLAIGVFLKEYGAGILKMLYFSFYTSMPMGISAAVGKAISNISPFIISISLAFAGGLILYITCRETLYQARETWKGRLSTVGNGLGMVLGVFFITFLHGL